MRRESDPLASANRPTDETELPRLDIVEGFAVRSHKAGKREREGGRGVPYM